MDSYSRRDFSRAMLASLCTAALVRSVGTAQAFEGTIKSAARKWIEQLKSASLDLRHRTITPIEWQRRVEDCLGHVDMKDLLTAIDYHRLVENAQFEEDHETQTKLDVVGGESTDPWAFGAFFFALKKDVSVVPHGHHNLVTTHMILQGKAHGRHFERVRDEPGHITIKPATDAVIGPGVVTTISDQKHNVHWFTALDGPVFMFNMQLGGISPGMPTGGRDYLDPNGEKLSGGLIRARRIGQAEAYKLYGHT
jgi:hypothetical protein